MKHNKEIDIPAVNVTFNPKNLLEKDHKVERGDFVTTNDGSPLKIYIAGTKQHDLIPLYSIGLTAEGDDIYVKRFFAAEADVIYLEDAYVNVDGVLWRLREQLKEDPEF